MFAGSPFLAESAALEHGLADAHPATLASRNDVAVARLTAGRALEAVDVFDALLLDCRSALGDSQPTLVVEGNLAAARFQAGQEESGLQLMAANLANRETVLGEEHPDTLTARDALATAHRLAGRLPDALVLASDLHTVTLRWCLGSMQAAVGNVDIAVDELGRALVDTEALLGSDHPDTASIRVEVLQLTPPAAAAPPARLAGPVAARRSKPRPRPGAEPIGPAVAIPAARTHGPYPILLISE